MNTYSRLMICLTLLSGVAFGQHKFSYGINLGGQISPLTIQRSNMPDPRPRFSGEDTEGKSRFEIGAYLQYEVANRVFVRTGINYQRASYSYTQGGFILPNQISPTGEILDGSTNYNNWFSFSTIAIPLDLGYRIATKKANVNFLIGGGFAFNGTLSEKTEVQIREASTGARFIEGVENTFDISPVSLRVFAGVELGLGSTFALAIEPHLKYSPSNFTLDIYGAEVSTRFEPGLSIRLRRK